MENKGGFCEHLCPRECLAHPSAVSNKRGYFQVWVCFFTEEQAPECERNVLSKQRQWPQCAWSGTAGRKSLFILAGKKKAKKKKCWQQCERVCACAWPPPLPQPTTATWPQRWLILCVHTDTHRHTEILKSKQLTRISSAFVVVVKPWMHRTRCWGSVDTDQTPRTVLDDKEVRLMRTN